MNQEINVEEDIRERYKDLIGLIKYFVDTYRWGVVDRLALAMSYESIEASLYDMLRLVESLQLRRIRIRIVKGSKTYDTTCCEYGENLGYGIYGKVEEVYEGPKNLKGNEIFCVPCPPKISMEIINDFLKKARKDPSIARRIAVLSFGLKEKE